jgi:hypothetical protein
MIETSHERAGKDERGLSSRQPDLAGDTTALRLCLERVVPARKSRTLKFELPSMERAEDLPAAMGAILDQVAEGGSPKGVAAALSLSALSAQADVHLPLDITPFCRAA